MRNGKSINKRLAILSAILGLILSLMWVLGVQLDTEHRIIWEMSTFASILETFVALSVAIYFLFKHLQDRKAKRIRDEKPLSRIKIFWILFLVGVIFLAISFPGVYGYDGIFQLRQFDTHTFTTHYSFLYMNFFGVIINIVKGITGSYEIAFAVYVLVQLVIINLILTRIICYCYERTKSRKVAIAIILFYVLHLPLQILNISSAQDVLFGGLFALLVLEVVKMISEKDYFEKPKNLVLTGVLVILMCMARNNGFFALVPFVIVGG